MAHGRPTLCAAFVVVAVVAVVVAVVVDVVAVVALIAGDRPHFLFRFAPAPKRKPQRLANKSN